VYTYRIYDFDFDETKSFDLLHKTKFTKEKYENIVNECRKKVWDKIRRNTRIIESLKDDEEIPEEKAEELELWSCNGEWDFHTNLRKILINDYGFEEFSEPLWIFTLHGGFYGKGQTIENRVEEN
jgi:hypothetical protein